MDWQDIFWACDLSYVLRLYWHSFSATESDPSAKAISALFENIKWVLERNPKKAYICLDSGESVRKKIYADYKSGRDTTPPEFWGTYDGALRCLEGLRDYLCVVSAIGWEADDCMASIARLAREDHCRCVLMTQDKDIRQCLRPSEQDADGKLITPGVTSQRRLRKDTGQGTEWGYFTCAQAEDDWGVPRSQFIDYQVLVGDRGDSIPHPRNIGPKKAVMLLSEYGSVANIKQQTIGGSIGKALADFWPMEPIVRQLVTLNDHVDFKNVLL